MVKPKILLLPKFTYLKDTLEPSMEYTKQQLAYFNRMNNNLTPIKKVPVPKEALHLYSSKHLTDKYFVNPNLVIMGPCPFENLARIQPTVLFPGCYGDNHLL